MKIESIHDFIDFLRNTGPLGVLLSLIATFAIQGLIVLAIVRLVSR
jgi:hypothetical protein